MPNIFVNLDDIQIYELLLDGIIQNFPPGFWSKRSLEEAKEVAIRLLKYLLDERLKFSKEDIKREVSKKFLTNYKLHTASKLFGRSAIRYAMIAYPDAKFQPWQFSQDKVPSSYWTIKENRISAIKYLFEVELRWNIDDIKEKLDWIVIRENGLATLHGYYPSLYKIVDAVYPNRINEWELLHSEVPYYFWRNINSRKRAIKWLVKEKLKLNPTQALIKLKSEHFSQYGLTELLCKYYNYSIKRAINEAFERK